jgi:small subunit ribosomal protein S1
MSDPKPPFPIEAGLAPANLAASTNSSEDAMPESSFGDILSQFEQEQRSAPVKQTITGTVVSVNPESVILDIGRKMEGILSFQTLRDAGAGEIKKGDEIPVTITGTTEQGYYELSAFRVDRPKDWTALIAAFDSKATITGRVVELVKGGLRRWRS